MDSAVADEGGGAFVDPEALAFSGEFGIGEANRGGNEAGGWASRAIKRAVFPPPARPCWGRTR